MERSCSSSSDLVSVVKVSTWAALLMTYARFAAVHSPPGGRRLLALLPAISLLPFLPLSFSSIHLRAISAFFLTWLATFKLLLLSFGLPPLSPSLPLSTFIATASLPLKLRSTTTSSSSSRRSRRNTLIGSLARAALLATILPIYPHRQHLHPYALLSIYCLHIYLALNIVLDIAAGAAVSLLGLDIEPQFNAPYRASSLRDFWGRRWNLMVTAILRPSVYIPVRRLFGAAAGVAATFLVSGLMHEVMFWYITSNAPTGEVTCFFLLHGACVLAEGRLRRAGWRLPQPAAAATLGFVAVTAFWLFFPPVLRGGADERVLEEYAAMTRVLEGGGRAVGRWVGSLTNRTGHAAAL